MDIWLDSDGARSASHREMIRHLCGPFISGAVDTDVPIDNRARIKVSGSSREPLLLIAPAHALGAQTLKVRATFDPDGVSTALGPVEFGPYTEQGAYLPIFHPQIDEGTRTASAFTVALFVSTVDNDGAETPVPTATVQSLLAATLLEGLLGRFLYVSSAEKQRIRRVARELAAMRFLATSRDNALDRYGAELGVARFADQIEFDPKTKEVITAIRTGASGAPEREPDLEYRRRLQLYRSRILPNRKLLLGMLNGPGQPGDDNQSSLGEMGLKQRFDIIEKTNPFAISIHLVATGDDKFRTNFLSFVRSVFLVWPANSANANQTHTARYLPSATRQNFELLRTSLRESFQFADEAAIAPMLAAALDRVGRCRRALGDTSIWNVVRAQDAAAGSRYELGLGVDVPPLPAATLDQMGTALKSAGRAPSADAEIEALIRNMSFVAATQDPEGSWLLEPCGLQTVHRVNPGAIYLSHLPTYGMTLNGASLVPAAGQRAEYEARFQAPGDPGSHVVLVSGLDAAAKSWTASGGEGWTVLSDAAAQAAWSAALDPQPAVAINEFKIAGLPGIEKPGPVIDQMKKLPPELLQTVRLGPGQAARILAGQPAAGDELRRLKELLQTQNLNSVLPMVTGAAGGPNEVLMVVGVVALPGAGLNLSERRSTGFRWYVVPLDGAGGRISIVGSRASYVPSSTGLAAIVTLGYARRGLVDPYEYRIELPPGGLLNLLQYEFLMNLLERTFPAGVEVNTYSIRREHVDLEGKGTATPLPPGTSRSYRQFRQARQRGELSVLLD